MRKKIDFYSPFTKHPEHIEAIKRFARCILEAYDQFGQDLEAIKPEPFGSPEGGALLEYCFNIEDYIGDLFDIPEDNTIQTDPNIHYGDDWPDWAYCRDWMTELMIKAMDDHDWQSVVDTIAQISLNGHDPEPTQQ
jgi:hypothetical protein